MPNYLKRLIERVGVPLRCHPAAQSAVHDASAQSALCDGHKGKEAGDPRGYEEGAGHGGAAGDKPGVHGLAKAM